jgi:hypothetical protein
LGFPHQQYHHSCDVKWYRRRIVAYGLGAKLRNHAVKEAVNFATDLLICSIGGNLNDVSNEDLKIRARSLDIVLKCVRGGFDGFEVKYKREPIVQCLEGGFDPVKD